MKMTERQTTKSVGGKYMQNMLLSDLSFTDETLPEKFETPREHVIRYLRTLTA